MRELVFIEYDFIYIWGYAISVLSKQVFAQSVNHFLIDTRQITQVELFNDESALR